jgi:cytidylate kinase
MIVTIDGPAGSGKSTIARLLAKKLGWMYLDTGAMYRVTALIAKKNSLIDESSRKRLCELTQKSEIDLIECEGETRVLLDGRDVSAEIRNEEISELASQISTNPDIRSILVSKQRLIGEKNPNIVTEGRDQGSVVFPYAKFKFYLDADVTERAKRRFDQLQKSQKTSADYDQILASLKNRDHRDSTRSASPLVIPSAAIVIDTTHLSIDQVLSKLIEYITQTDR